MDVKDKVNKTLESSLSTSKKYLGIARDKARDFGDVSVLRLEIHQLEERVKKNKLQLGDAVFALLGEEGRQSVSLKTPELKDLFEQLEKNVKELADRREELVQRAESKKTAKHDKKAGHSD